MPEIQFQNQIRTISVTPLTRLARFLSMKLNIEFSYTSKANKIIIFEMISDFSRAQEAVLLYYYNHKYNGGFHLTGRSVWFFPDENRVSIAESRYEFIPSPIHCSTGHTRREKVESKMNSYPSLKIKLKNVKYCIHFFGDACIETLK